MYDVKAYLVEPGYSNINPMQVKRDWMDNTSDAHAYKCFPVSLANQIGWSISFPEDISFIWDGISNYSDEHIKIINGEKYVHAKRGNATLSFNTGYVIKTNNGVEMQHLPPPNIFIDGVQAFSTIINTSFFDGEFPCVLKVTRPHTEITIKANTPVISIVPFKPVELQNSTLTVENANSFKKPSYDLMSYYKEIAKINKSGNWSNFYRNATDQNGNIIGQHSVKNFKFNVIKNL